MFFDGIEFVGYSRLPRVYCYVYDTEAKTISIHYGVVDKCGASRFYETTEDGCLGEFNVSVSPLPDTPCVARHLITIWIEDEEPADYKAAILILRYLENRIHRYQKIVDTENALLLHYLDAVFELLNIPHGGDGNL